MQLGRFTIEQLSEGQFELFADGKINRTPVSDTDETASFAQQHNDLVGINPLYITDGEYHVLVDAGLGWGLDAKSSNTDVSNIRTNLRIFDIAPADITHVILSHLHYDHVAGISFTNEQTTTRATFPNATCVAQQSEWDFALEQIQYKTIHSKFYELDDLYRLYADDFFEFIEADEKEIIPGIELIKTGGHTPGHQAIKIADQEQSAYYLGDLLPSATHLNYFDVAALDVNRVQAKRMKIQLLRRVYDENAFLFFYHDLASKACQLTMDDDQNYVLKEQ